MVNQRLRQRLLAVLNKQPGAGENSVRNPRSPRSNNIRTLYDGPSDEADRQFYNGNQLNFEPRIDQDKND
ncbi:hypothetical protein CIHG_02263 [Coccidioides immitis H538.4]|uniref:Uncharacterized protein n=1 Tax=Coccidioides immitis H538.4 TaxID=396776 RepID=A0A0J8RKK5_COCIT|nr:hypothetical protein CIHG_02263 [Coccidioides immitis H538.4]